MTEIALIAASPSSSRSCPRSIARLRIALTYFWRHHRWPDFDRPRRFTEWVQWRKLNDRDVRMPALIDKVLVKYFVAGRLGSEWVIPTLWSGRHLPTEAPWPVPFVVKSRHGSNQIAFIGDSCPWHWASVQRRADRWMRASYGAWLDEWAYGQVERGIVVEPFVGGCRSALPVDYKFYVFGGQVAFIQIHLDRATRHHWVLLDRDWRAFEGGGTMDLPRPPTCLPEMISAAETLAVGFDFVRVDLYQPGERPLFGEMTFYPGSGLDPFDQPELDLMIGARWDAVREAAP